LHHLITKKHIGEHLNEIAKFRPLSREEEAETFKLIKLGDQRAIDKICKHNLLFVVSVAKRYSVMLGASSTLTLEDLISEGNIGLFIAINKFNPEEGNKFISYAVWWIKQCILASIQNNIKNIRIPSSVRSELNKINRKEQQLTQLFERSPSSIEIFEAMVDDGEMTQYY